VPIHRAILAVKVLIIGGKFHFHDRAYAHPTDGLLSRLAGANAGGL